jgi:hypothetical protein
VALHSYDRLTKEPIGDPEILRIDSGRYNIVVSFERMLAPDGRECHIWRQSL